jgi:hypothetical protein
MTAPAPARITAPATEPATTVVSFTLWPAGRSPAATPPRGAATSPVVRFGTGRGEGVAASDRLSDVVTSEGRLSGALAVGVTATSDGEADGLSDANAEVEGRRTPPITRVVRAAARRLRRPRDGLRWDDMTVASLLCMTAGALTVVRSGVR